MFGNIVLVIVAAAVAYAAFRFYDTYHHTPGTAVERVLASTKNSATVLWGYVVTVAGTLLGWSGQVADFVNMPEVHDFIQQHMKPEYVGAAFVAIGAVTVFARLRTLFQPDTAAPSDPL